MTKLTATIAAFAFIGLSAGAQAATVSLTTGDTFGNSSFNSAGGWSSAAAPSAGNAYQNNGFLLRTPATALSYTFAGDSLTITGSANFSAANNEALMWKGSGTTSVITVNNLIVNGGQLRHGQGDADSFTLAGSITVGASGAGFATQCAFYVTAALAGAGDITVMDNGSGGAARTVYFRSTTNTFSGNLILNNARSRATFDNGGVFNFVLGDNGVNNAIKNTGGGVLNLDGLFQINTSGANLTAGNTWNLVTGTVASYGTNFSIQGFTNSGGVWTNGAGTLQFSQTTGALTALAAVPEPSSFAAIAGLATLGVASLRRRRRSA